MLDLFEPVQYLSHTLNASVKMLRRDTVLPDKGFNLYFKQ